MFTITIEDQNGQVADTFSFDHGSYTIGRLDECDIVLPSNSVSRKHARLFIENNRCYVEDLDSANGVIVDGQRVVQTRDLGTASQIRVGEFYLYLEYQPPQVDGSEDVKSTLFIDPGSEHHKLVRINDSFAGEEFSLSEQRNTIGRIDENFILLSDSSISRKHAVIHRQGNDYFIEDLGSSNGTRLNGKEVDARKKLSPRDHVEFGSVEFIFAEGDAHISPDQPVPNSKGTSSMSYASGIAIVVVGLALGATVIFAVTRGGEDNAPAEMNLETEVEQLIERGEAHLDSGNWEEATAAFQEAYDKNPDDDTARKLRDQVTVEQQAADRLEEGRELIERGQHSEARQVLLEIPEHTRADRRAESIRTHLDQTLVHNLRTEANRLMRSDDEDDLEAAREKLDEALAISPDDDDLLEMAGELDEELEQ